MVKTLFELNKGDKGVINNVFGMEEKKIKRLIELGFVPFEKVEVINKQKNIILLGIRGYAICLDKQIASHIEISL